ncbi:MAG TPA: lysophospholipid acyltransferase family protein [Pseudomonadales bacterium]|jgi:KDO2-lipid IV(A) lauroyltransferase|nr:lipid A biosynthesis lauroyl acyltransferase [Gammaproteobacteria bacterium]MDP6025344.1 lysophospholipid acyltransferase family protein [Pseudomonadales bacterium]MDP6315062.1 lysophospholipid acyltransferase family protein [Pseudomonadales bacterium]MDP7315926.1 lysophospholipid acyltransferase family protein [Pseudomonadales bacterium]HJP52498.1 lysophospholipid acyltransferase family protein [Pseudomonadales bacterium]|tara:strand:+ start:1918 stop:2829 length:912 start_codon:yes stop_codon:yes gene_type:complete
MSVENLWHSLVKVTLWFLAGLPLGWSRWIGSWIGRFNYLLATRASKVTHENLALCFPHFSMEVRKNLARRSLIHTGQTMMETPAVWLGEVNRVKSWITQVKNEDLLDVAIESGKGVIVLLPHVGNWEMFNVYFSTKGRMTALYQPPRQEFLKPVMQEVRSNFGNDLVPTTVKGISRLYRSLEQGNVVTVLPDQVPLNGEYCPFFGQLALTDVLVSRLIKKTGAVAISCIVVRQKSGFQVCFKEVNTKIYSKELSESLQGLNSSIEASVQDHLEQYQWEYKRFRERPGGQKKLYKFKGQPDVYH